MTFRRTTILGLLIATVGVACVDLSAPKGPASISVIRLPAGFVVRGDVMRDSNGTPAMPIVDEFDASGHLIAGKAAQFFITDSAPVAHFDKTTGELVGDQLGTVHFIGQVGALQTPSATIPVTVQPTTLVKGQIPNDTIKAPLTQDSTAGSLPVPVIVRGVGDTAVHGVAVHFAFARTLASSDSSRPAVLFADERGNPITTDTTDLTGTTSRIRLLVRARFLADVAIATGQKVDSVIVQASASYRGTPLAGSPLTIVYHVIGVIGQ